MLRARDFLTDQKILRHPKLLDHPLVSVVLPTFRRYRTGQLARSVESVLGQTFKNFEFIIIDDGSTDGSFDFIQACQAEDPRVIHIRHERNSGIHSIRLNEGIELARGKYLICQFDDDTWRPHALATLVEEAQKHDDLSVVVGHSQFTNTEGGSQCALPSSPVDLVALYERNRFANNAVLFPSKLVDIYGMYDCHIGMRRLCDWDLWLRYMKHVPFIVVDKVITDVYEYNEGSLGLTVPYDIPLTRYLHDIPRDSLLTRERWRDYEIDSLRIGQVEIEKDFARRLYEEQIVPYYLKFRHHFPQVEGFSNFYTAKAPQKQLFFTKSEYDTCVDATLQHYDASKHVWGHYRSHFQILSQVQPNWIAEADLLLLVRTVEEHGKALLDQALRDNVPVGLHLDDDLLHFYEYGRDFDYLAPGTPYHTNLEEFLSQVDAVWATTPAIAQSVSAYTPRHIPHNIAIPEIWLPDKLHPRSSERPIRIGYVGGGYRIDEFREIWGALQKISREYGDGVNFEFWGLDVSSLPKLHSPVKQFPFNFSYLGNIDRLRNAQFDILLTPLLDHPRPRLAKSIIKYLETAAAGALGLFSDVPPYESLPDGLTCIKAKNTREDWYAALKAALDMPISQFDLMRQRATTHVRQEFTAEAQLYKHEAAAQATEFHAKTRGQRTGDGRPRVMYVLHSVIFGGAEMQLWRRFHLARRYGVEPVVVLPEAWRETKEAEKMRQMLENENISVDFAEYFCAELPKGPHEYRNDSEKADVTSLLERWKPALVHTTTFIATFGQLCTELGIPHVASLYQVKDSFSWGPDHSDFTHCVVNHSDTIRYARRWRNLLGSEPYCSRIAIPPETLELGLRKSLKLIGSEPPDWDGRTIELVAMGTLQPRKCQLETIEAVGRLRKAGLSLNLRFYGYDHFYPDYMEACRQCIQEYDLQKHVAFDGFIEDIVEVLQVADILLSFSNDESFPGVIAEAMAAGVLVIATPIGGISELVIDGVSGILCADNSMDAMIDGLRRALDLSPAKRQQIVEQARRVAWKEFHPDLIAKDLFVMYNRAIEITQGIDKVPVRAYNRETQMLPAEVRFPIWIGSPRAGRRIKSGLRYELKIGYANWAGISVCLGTIRPKQPFKGRLTLKIYDLDNGSRSRKPIRLVDVEIDEIKNYGWADFYFDPIHNSENRRFRVEFCLNTHDLATRSDLCLLESKDFRTSLWNKFYHKYLRFGKGGVLAYRIRVGA